MEFLEAIKKEIKNRYPGSSILTRDFGNYVCCRFPVFGSPEKHFDIFNDCIQNHNNGCVMYFDIANPSFDPENIFEYIQKGLSGG